MKGHHTEQLISQFGTKIGHACDPATAKFLGEHAGTFREEFITLSPGRGEEPGGGSISEKYESVLKPHEFFTLKTGGEANGFVVEGIVLRGKLFSGNRPYLRVAFSQK